MLEKVLGKPDLVEVVKIVDSSRSSSQLFSSISSSLSASLTSFRLDGWICCRYCFTSGMRFARRICPTTLPCSNLLASVESSSHNSFGWYSR